MSEIRVLHCLVKVGSGGVEQRRLSLARGLDSSIYNQRLICTQTQGGLPASFDEAGCPIDDVGRLDGIFDLKRYRSTLRIVREFRPHIIHGAVFEGVALASLCGRFGRVPVVIGEETSDPRNRRWKGHLLARLLAGLTDHCVGVSPSAGRYLTDTIHVPASKVSVINNGVEMPELPSRERLAELRAELGIDDSDFVIGSVGRMVDEQKRFGDLIQAISRLADIPHVKLLLLGDGRQRSRLEQLAVKLGVRGRVIFAGYQFVVGHFLGLMDVFALVSEREAFGLVNAEAMRCSLPVVATRVGGIPDVVRHNETGLLVDPRDIEAMVRAFRRMIADPELSMSMGAAGKLRADREFSAESYIRRVDNLYQRLWAERRR